MVADPPAEPGAAGEFRHRNEIAPRGRMPSRGGVTNFNIQARNARFRRLLAAAVAATAILAAAVGAVAIGAFAVGATALFALAVIAAAAGRGLGALGRPGGRGGEAEGTGGEGGNGSQQKL